MKKFIFVLAIAVINLAVIVTVGEIYARVKHGDRLEMQARESDYRQVDMVLHHSLVPGGKGRSLTGEWDVEYSINSYGLREDEFSPGKEPGTYRIMLLGDSFTEGYGVSARERFSEVLEGLLKRTDAGYEIINAGVASYSPLLEYLYLKEKGLEIDPDMVVLFFDLGDLRDDLEYEMVTRFDASGKPAGCAPLKRVRGFSDNPLERFLVRHSRFYLYIENRINNLLYKLREGEPDDEFSGDDPSGFNRFVAFHGEGTALVDRLWTRSEKYLDLIHGLLEDRGIEFVLAVYPYAVEIDGIEWSEGRQEYGFEVGKVYPRPGIRARIKSYAESRGIGLIDLYPYMKEADDGPLYFAFDGHFTPRGHEVIGKGLYRELEDILAKN